MPQSGYIIENYARAHKDPNTAINRFVKSVVQPQEVRYCTVHWHAYKGLKKAVDENGKPLHSFWTTANRKNNFSAKNSTRLIRINHYFSKSKEEYLEKIKRGHLDKAKLRYSEAAWNYPEWQADSTMQEAVRALREKGVPETYSPDASSQPPNLG